MWVFTVLHKLIQCSYHIDFLLTGFQLDSQASLSYLLSRKDIDTSKIVIFGRSLGGAVAIDLASNELYLDKALALIVENTFTSIPGIADQLVMNGISRLPYFCFRNKVSCKELLAEL